MNNLLSALKPVQREVITLRFGLEDNEQMTLAQVAQRLFRRAVSLGGGLIGVWLYSREPEVRVDCVNILPYSGNIDEGVIAETDSRNPHICVFMPPTKIKLA